MSGVNKVILIGRLGKDPETKTLESGKQVTNLSLATSESFIDGNGDKQEVTEWHTIILWGKLSELASEYLRKGREVYIEGKIKTRSWENAEGEKRYATEILGNSMTFIGGNNSNNFDESPF